MQHFNNNYVYFKRKIKMNQIKTKLILLQPYPAEQNITIPYKIVADNPKSLTFYSNLSSDAYLGVEQDDLNRA